MYASRIWKGSWFEIGIRVLSRVQSHANEVASVELYKKSCGPGRSSSVAVGRRRPWSAEWRESETADRWKLVSHAR
jgi:hypothetical protein